ncbi:hypothetical protein GGI24_002360 [Coemansia furcata]|nr:hypothetical protein GGI24_002360 [Coemansia furcata]
MNVEAFESSVQSLISIKQEKPKSIDDEYFKMWSPINSDKYNFDKSNEEIEHLKQLSKDDLLAFWDKYVNEDTAQRYTRLDLQMWSAKIWQPTAEEFEMYPSTLYSSKKTQLIANEEEPRIVFEGSSKVATALQMAISSISETPKFAALSKTNFTNIDMKQSPEGIWLIHDYRQFQRTQALHGISVPTRKLVPIIQEAIMEEGS